MELIEAWSRAKIKKKGFLRQDFTEITTLGRQWQTTSEKPLPGNCFGIAKPAFGQNTVI